MNYKKNLELCREIIGKSRTIAISGHINPDGDSLGSLLSLGLGLKKLKKTVYMISADRIPGRYRGLPGAGDVIVYTRKKCDLAIAVDCGSKELLGNTYKVFKRA
ncbi:MAG: bifunctional oligoribonuclease/PAP phosphatase NrnA, partial [Candidatus Omnitrophica bacterium]|nr:bifunctional oligoribonuclease/PAP phosphatase NrnA [Candidatus Omnitrophota bacterium]MBD3268580.1 bifunctional oligoribonuclease/PAP phosphatase NrnA [Candidatus Omnitrophota bacterium]